jgi:16S rRNA (cytosine1402-N4)-methyltransferase
MKHFSVLLEEAVTGLQIKPTGLYIDATLGGGGHAEVILSHLTTGQLLGFDQDPFAIHQAKERLARFHNVTYIPTNFQHLKTECEARGISHVDGILMDIGVSSFQLDDPKRGFSYHHDAALDMRMNPEQDTTAATILATYSKEQLKAMFTQGEVPFTNRLVDEILNVRTQQPITTTMDLVEIVQRAAPRIEKQKRHPARLVFQALRMETNDELGVLERTIHDALSMLRVGGRCAIITFHSLEDRIVKQAFHKASSLDIPKGVPIATKGMSAPFQLITKKPIVPSDNELLLNSRSKSAKLRVIERLHD